MFSRFISSTYVLLQGGIVSYSMRACTSDNSSSRGSSNRNSSNEGSDLDYIFDRGQFFRSAPSLAAKVKRRMFPDWLPNEKPKTLSLGFKIGDDELSVGHDLYFLLVILVTLFSYALQILIGTSVESGH